KRVPGVEINVQIVQAIKIDKLDFHRVCLQSETAQCAVFFICIRKVSAPPSPNTMIATRAIQPYLSIGLYY
ncbi:hypothetical protein ACIGQ5_25340, partial [Peribacillus frigoritolerans]|uniref:hypothetical protein n=1 Tax=Peribacillus frigoritolerans TaxID=450367 RepID=UPI0037CC3AB2